MFLILAPSELTRHHHSRRQGIITQPSRLCQKVPSLISLSAKFSSPMTIFTSLKSASSRTNTTGGVTLFSPGTTTLSLLGSVRGVFYLAKSCSQIQNTCVCNLRLRPVSITQCVGYTYVGLKGLKSTEESQNVPPRT